ncbi:universal stress protein [Halomicroarcula sp. F27]|uniref:Universal stress protein n=1 Tax=Haloarcula nitratireducens TaxID=2487749 RepID=A0AAW4PIT3_9EURY|nr:universal stress protein [Halomicroarcula nitratireducens]MBX0297844.1 universal stress protein [Halomicroarcula nitratireducens]
MSRCLLGSVTEKVVRLASIPVLTVRMQPDEQLAVPYGNIPIPTDGSAGTSHAAEHSVS